MTKRFEQVVEVAVAVPLRHTLTYGVPAELSTQAVVGARALVQVGRRKMTGLITSDPAPPGTGDGPRRLRGLLEVLDDEPLIEAELLTFLIRAADYYLCPVGEAIRTALPPGMAPSERGGQMQKPRERERRVLHARAAGSPSEDGEKALSRAPARAKLFDRLRAVAEPLPVPLLRREFPRATQLLERLESDGLVILDERPAPLDPLLAPPLERERPKELTDDQGRAVSAITNAAEQGGYKGFLLHGVTGSGKTEVYIQAIEAVLASGRNALVLVPEIALTPQLVSRFRARLGSEVGVLHSGLREAQRLSEWRRFRAGEARVAIGARSAVFAPLENIGIVVVDEEHDPSYKQSDGFRYHGRDLALLRALRVGAVAVLGSATPSLETYHNTEVDKLELLELPDRVTPRPLPEVEIIDLRRHRSGPGSQRAISGPLVSSLIKCIEAGEQAIVFLNRRGYAPVAVCTACGEPVRCLGCSVSLTYHRRSDSLECHYCGHSRPLPEHCPDCSAGELRLLGAGTERIEETLLELLGDRARIARLDSDVAPGRASEAVIETVRSGRANVLVGTQMVTKGHDLPGVTFVGVLLADGSLHLPDFRAAERTFQLLTQVAGRAGRGETAGRVMVQTYDPDHPAVRFAARHAYDEFYPVEMSARRELSYPPYSHLAAIRLSGGEEGRVLATAEALAARVSRSPRLREGTVMLVGPAPEPISRVRGRFRYRLLLKGTTRPVLREVLEGLVELADSLKGGIRIAFDVDPVHLL